MEEEYTDRKLKRTELKSIVEVPTMHIPSAAVSSAPQSHASQSEQLK